MIQDTYKNSDDFYEKCICAREIYNYIDNIKSNVRWFFHKGYMLDNHNKYVIDFSSYDTPDYKDFRIAIMATFNSQNQTYDLEVIHKNEPF